MRAIWPVRSGTRHAIRYMSCTTMECIIKPSPNVAFFPVETYVFVQAQTDKLHLFFSQFEVFTCVYRILQVPIDVFIQLSWDLVAQCQCRQAPRFTGFPPPETGSPGSKPGFGRNRGSQVSVPQSPASEKNCCG